MIAPKVLIVDDEPSICDLIQMTLQRMEIDARTAGSIQDARTLLATQHFDLCFTDMRLPDGNGISLVKHIQDRYPDVPVAVITAYGSMETAVEALKAGAFDFMAKPVNLNNLRNLVNTALKLESGRKTAGPLDRLLGESPPIRELRSFIERVSRSDAPVHVHGESGTGKELVARLIHERSPRRDGPFVPVNCGAIPAELMESEFFGHKKGSFTGAVSDKEGLFQAAAHGTLFLDEVADLPMLMQVKLLRAIQERAARPVGDTKEQPVDIRFISATNKRLDELVADGSFRQDLYYRINVLPISTPGLRGQIEDIPLLADDMLRRLCPNETPPVLSPGALEALAGYRFPGNVRELENMLERAVALCIDGRITEADLMMPSAEGAGAFNDGPAIPDSLEKSDHESLPEYIERVERAHIEEALDATGRNKTAAANRLGISFRAFRYKLQKLGIK